MDVGITEAMAQHGIPGGVLGDGRVAHAQGYGHTDLERHAPVDAASTRFDISSVSKLLTATAVMHRSSRAASTCTPTSTPT
jgi:CubicO group peptidase (beta-lactamase class C family)